MNFTFKKKFQDCEACWYTYKQELALLVAKKLLEISYCQMDVSLKKK